MPEADGRGRRVLALALAASLLLHLLLVLILEFSYTPPPVTYRITFQLPSTRFSQPPQPFAPGPPVPGGLPQPLEFPAGTGPGFSSDLPGPPASAAGGNPELPGFLSGSGIEGLLPPKPLDFKAPELTLPDFNALAIEQVRALAEEREGYARFRLFDFDADTTDAESRRRSRAKQIVERAIAAMGGREALLAIREMKARVWLESTESCWTGQPVQVPPYVYPVAVWHYTMQGAFTNKHIEVKISLDPALPNPDYALRLPCSLGSYYSLFDSRWSFPPSPTPREIPEIQELQQAGKLREQGEAARWHFIDHFLGEGVNISYIGNERLEGRLFASNAKDRSVEVIRVEDERYGQLQEASFDQETGLLLATVDGLTPEEQTLFRRAYPRLPIPVWTTTCDRYQPVQGVLTPHRLVRSGVIVHLKVAYNGEEPDPSIPDLEE